MTKTRTMMKTAADDDDVLLKLEMRQRHAAEAILGAQRVARFVR